MMSWQKLKSMIGIDEVGRGCIAGEVYACALFFKDGAVFDFTIKDSKKLSSLQREKIYDKTLKQEEIKFAIGTASIKEIEDLNILNATMLAMERAYRNLGIFDTNVFIDGNKKPDGILNAECVIGGDDIIPQISLASIIAKVTRDRVMIELENKAPGYGFAKHKGYGTKAHFEAIKQLGLSEFHRKDWCKF